MPYLLILLCHFMYFDLAFFHTVLYFDLFIFSTSLDKLPEDRDCKESYLCLQYDWSKLKHLSYIIFKWMNHYCNLLPSSLQPTSVRGFQWPPSVGYCYPFRGKFPAQGSIIIPINDDIIHAAKICMLPAKTFPWRGYNPCLFRNPSLQMGNVFALYRSVTHGNSLPHCASESFKTPGDFYVHL